jgi:hypothetical protein
MSQKIIVIGAGASGMMASIIASRNHNEVILLEKLPKIGAKLKATGGGRCNLTNRLSNEEFMLRFGREGRFMTPALEIFDYKELQSFFKSIGVETHAPDGFRIFPIGHNSSTIIKALKDEMERLGVRILSSQRVEALEFDDSKFITVRSQNSLFKGDKVIIATGGMGYPILGAEGDGYKLAQSVGHKISTLYPAMMPLKTKESWVANCRADTIAKVEIRVNIKKYKKLSARGDLIFTKNGIRGPVVLDFSREITPLLSKFNSVPILINLTKGMNQEDIRRHFKNEIKKNNNHTTLSLVETLLPTSIALELCKLAHAEGTLSLNRLSGVIRDRVIELLAWTPLTVTGHDGFKMAMVTRGGVSLKEVNSKTLMSKKIEGLYFCGEVLDLDGPCGGYNLQWAFSSGFLSGLLL